MKVRICAWRGDLQQHTPRKVFQSYKVTITKRAEEEEEEEEELGVEERQVAMTSLSSSSLDASL